jgi:Type IIA topoisomerase (DNA gyrase/topo II, topoisomerase IV), A subunit
MSDLTMFANDEIQEYPISRVAKNEWLSFAKYTVEARAIPNMIDGMKPVQRFYLYSSILNSKRDFKKVSAVSGIISDYGYNHGESSAAGSGQLMAATWNNNICLVEGRGSFGTRLVQEAGAPRYVYTRLHENFNRYIKDIDLSPVHDDPEHEPPAFYLPAIPLVLANGTKGIATGFATNILPHDPKSIKAACLEYITTGNIKNRIALKFPEFNGTVEKDKEEPNKYTVSGVYEKRGKTQLIITEVPYGFDRESYVKVLDGLEEDGDIVSYEDQCDKTGFKFEVKLKQNTSAIWNKSKIISKFKLSKPMTQNLTVIDQNGKLREYEDARQLVKDFCDYRNSILQQRIDLRTKEEQERCRWLNVKMQFIQAVLDSKIEFKNKKKKDVTQQIYEETHALNETDIDKLLRINILSLTDEMVKDLAKESKEAQKNLKFWSKELPKNQFIKDLEEI